MKALMTYAACLIGLGLTVNAQQTNSPATQPAVMPVVQQKSESRKGPPAVPTLFPKKEGVPLSPRVADRISPLMAKYDTNGDGILSPDEMANYLADQRAARQARMEKYDLNHDGRLDEHERELMWKDIRANHPLPTNAAKPFVVPPPRVRNNQNPAPGP